MMNKKRMLVSLGAGILLFVVGLFSLLLIYRLVNSPAWLATVIVWMIVWPFRIFLMVVCIPHYPEKAGVALMLAGGAAADIAILTQLVYLALSRFSGKSRRTAPPPPPPAYQ